jgi:hypothetical protein
VEPTSNAPASSTARADHVLRPAPGTPPQEPDHLPQPTQPARDRNWTITTTNGYCATGHLPWWAQDDPSTTGVPPEKLHIELADITHQADVTGLILPVSHATLPPQESAVLAVTIECKPYPDDEEEDHSPRLPVINVQIVDDFWITNLDPPAAAAFGEQLRALGEHLTHHAAPLLAAARTQWTAHATPKPRTTRTTRTRNHPRKLNQEPSAVTHARERAGLTKRALAKLVGISEQLMNESAP